MSYLQLDSGIPDFSQAVISFWFRVPVESFAAAAAAPSGNEEAILERIVPLVVMGARGTGKPPLQNHTERMVSATSTGYNATGLSYEQIVEDLGPCPEHGAFSRECSVTDLYSPAGAFVPAEPETGYRDMTTTVASGEAPRTDPSHIGVFDGRLVVNFETGKSPSVSGYADNITLSPLGEEVTIPGDPGRAFKQGTVLTTGCSLPFLGVPFYDKVVTDDTHMVEPPDSTAAVAHETYVDISELLIDATGSIFSDQIPVTPDQWHHVLISVDLQTIETHGGSFDSSSRLFVALDDVNYTGDDLSRYGPPGDPNGIVSSDAQAVALSTGSYLLDTPSVPSGGHPIGLPGTAQCIIYPVEMAEFQMWTGVTLDTGDETNRRAFIDGAGRPVNPRQKADARDPTSQPGPEDVLGKKPEIMLHGSGNWIAGKNTGVSLVLNEIGKPVPQPGKAFSATGLIVGYSPDPSLYGAQFPAAAALR
jgi:hypothetical protein